MRKIFGAEQGSNFMIISRLYQRNNQQVFKAKLFTISSRELRNILGKKLKFIQDVFRKEKQEQKEK